MTTTPPKLDHAEPFSEKEWADMRAYVNGEKTSVPSWITADQRRHFKRWCALWDEQAAVNPAPVNEDEKLAEQYANGGSHPGAYTAIRDVEILAQAVLRLSRELAEARQWVNDLQSGMYVNCVYCGHRYGPGETTPVSMADALKAHIEKCPQHPLAAERTSRIAAEAARDKALAEGAWSKLESTMLLSAIRGADYWLNAGGTPDVEQARNMLKNCLASPEFYPLATAYMAEHEAMKLIADACSFELQQDHDGRTWAHIKKYVEALRSTGKEP